MMPSNNSKDTIANKEETNPFQASVEPLSKGLLEIFEPHLIKMQSQLHELAFKEATISNEIHNENLNISEVQHSDDLQKMFHLMENYQKKLVNIKKDIKFLHDKSVKLKKRALKLQQHKEKQEYIRVQKESQVKKELESVPKDNVQ